MEILKLSKIFLEKDFEEFNIEDGKLLNKIISFHDELYYNKEDPIIWDSEYDNLKKLLQKIEDKFNLKKDSEKVWADILDSTFEKKTHPRPMLSLDNTYNEDDLIDFDKKIKNILPELKWTDIDYAIEYKFDWLSLRISYQDWIITEAVTRWNWIQWEDVTQNAKMISNIPHKINTKWYFEVRWEVMMYNDSFEKLNKSRQKAWEQLFSNPRNAASGSLRQKKSNITKERNLAFFGYDSPLLEGDKTHIESIKHLENLGFTTESRHIKCKWISWVIDYIREIWNKKSELPFEIDGLVIKINDINLWEELWMTAHHPRWAIAYKFPAEVVSTKILSVEHSVWRTWTITPVANLEPVNIGWVIVRRATLHNYEEVVEKNVKIWDYVFVRRAWEVIPEIIWPIESQRTWNEEEIKVPENCPICNSKTKKEFSKVRYYCGNYSCPVQIKEKLAYSVWKTWFNIEWFWPAIVQRFLDENLITDLASIFDLKDKKEEILKLDWFKEKSVNNLLESIEKVRKIPIEKLIIAFWIPWIWKWTSKEISKLFNSNDDILDFKHEFDEIINLKDIWPEIAKNIIDFMNNTENKEILKDLLSKISIVFNKNINQNWPLLGKVFCITWSFEGYSRDDLSKIIEDNSWTFTNTVSKKIDFLLAWEKAGSKISKAETLWIKVIDIEKLFNMI